jgi:hypothetical protein
MIDVLLQRRQGRLGIVRHVIEGNGPPPGASGRSGELGGSLAGL